MSDELKPCPFCGGEAEIWSASENRKAWISCMGRCAVLITREHKTDDEAIVKWNTRAAADALTAAQEENERLVHDIERLSASLSAEVTGSERLREAAFSLRNAQRAYMEDRGNDEKGRAVGMAAAALDAALDGLPK